MQNNLSLTVEVPKNFRSLRLSSIQINGEGWLEPGGKRIDLKKRAANYSWALVVLFAKFRIHKGPIHEFSLTNKDFADEVQSLRVLMNNARPTKNKKTGVAQEQRSRGEYKWSSLFLRTKNPKSPVGSSSYMDLLLTDNDKIRFADDVIQPENVKIVLETSDGGRPLDSDEDYSHFWEMLELARDPFDCMAFQFANRGLRKGLTYFVNFGHKPIRPEKAGPIEAAFSSSDYYHFHSTMEFYRISLENRRTFRINVFSAGEYDNGQAAGLEGDDAEGAIYGEEFSVLKQHKAALEKILELASKDQSLSALSKAFYVSAEVDETPAQFEKIEVTPKGYSLQFAISDQNVATKKLKHRYRFEFTGFWPRKRWHFPMMLTEGTRDGHMVFDYRDADFQDVSFFLGTQIGLDNRRAQVHNYEDHKRVEVKWHKLTLFPGQGAVFFWKGATNDSRIETQLKMFYEKQFNELEFDLRPKVLAGECSAKDYYTRFWSLQFNQYLSWKSGQIPDTVYSAWLLVRSHEWNKNEVFGDISYRDGWRFFIENNQPLAHAGFQTDFEMVFGSEHPLTPSRVESSGN